MTPPPTASINVLAARPFFRACFTALLAGCFAASLPVTLSRAQPAGAEDNEAEVLTRGPVHEAFAGVVSYNPEPGIVVKKAPPELIEEIPPAEKPEGDDIAWIPGYWAWDDERDDYVWISGTWRALPPGREWIAGYWRETGDGYQWISGYWADAAKRETTFLPPPPRTLEVGPNIDAPSPDYGWTPGCWEWQQDRYAWRAGYWAPGRVNWVWVPSYYIWTPRGVIFVAGFWDYVVERRGLLFAPVYYRHHVRPGYYYSPRIVTSVAIFDDCLFLRPRYHHYYFGDYYDSRYDRGGFYASFSFQSHHRGYDPFYAHRRWEHRADRDWDNRFRASYQYRREHEAARPPRTWSAQMTFNARPDSAGQLRTPLAAPIEQLAARTDNPVQFQRVAEGDRQRFGQRGREVQQTREQRRTVETRPAVATVRSESAPAAPAAPASVAAPRSPFVGKPSGQRARNQTPSDQPPAPPAVPSSPARRETSGRPPDASSRNAPADPGQPGTERRNRQNPAESRSGAVATPPQAADPASAMSRAQQIAEARARAAAGKAPEGARAPQPANRANEAAVQAREEFQRQQQAQATAQQEAAERTRAIAERVQEAARKQQQAADQANAAAAQLREESLRQPPSPERAQANERRRGQDAETAAREQAQAAERANAVAARAQEEARGQQQATERALAAAAAARAQGEAQRNAQPAPGRTQPDGTRRVQNGSEAERTARAKARAAADENDDANKPK